MKRSDFFLLQFTVCLSVYSGWPSQQAFLTRETGLRADRGRSSDISQGSHDPVTEGWMQGQFSKAWENFTRDGRYRWAGENDFSIPDWATERYQIDIKRGIKTPIQAGHIKHSYLSTEIAIIVVDTLRQASNCYGITVFSQRKDRPSVIETKWLYRGRDLSHSILNWSSGDTLGIIRYEDDGSYWSGFVEWDPKTREYACKLRHIK